LSNISSIAPAQPPAVCAIAARLKPKPNVTLSN
jgi:hypothetical protein